MLDIVTWTVVKNDEYYIDMAIKSVLPYVRGLYIQDQMSDDGTYEVIGDFQSLHPDKIICERVNTGHIGRFESSYNEPHWRSLALERAERTFDPEWLLKLDADEIYTDHFFKEVQKIEGTNCQGVWVAGDRFVSKEYRTVYPGSIECRKNGYAYVDPHMHMWRGNLHVRYRQNPAMSGFLHCIPTVYPHPVQWIKGICNIHLHRIFGPKSLAFWSEGGDQFDPNVRPFHAPSMAPRWFASPFNMGNAEKTDFVWPDFVLEKWKSFGIW